jgi:hypothetical protein
MPRLPQAIELLSALDDELFTYPPVRCVCAHGKCHACRIADKHQQAGNAAMSRTSPAREAGILSHRVISPRVHDQENLQQRAMDFLAAWLAEHRELPLSRDLRTAKIPGLSYWTLLRTFGSLDEMYRTGVRHGICTPTQVLLAAVRQKNLTRQSKTRAQGMQL